MNLSCRKKAESILCSAMEREAISKNRVSLKNHRSKGKLLSIAILFIVFCSISVCTFAQDIITLKNGNEIQALVQKIGADEIEYKKFDNKNGPVYTMKKSEIFMIKYINGRKDVFTDEIMENIANNNDSANTPGLDTLLYDKGIITDIYGNALSNKEILNVMQRVPEASRLYNLANRQAWFVDVWFVTGSICALTGFIIMFANSSPSDDTKYLVADLVGGGFVLATIGYVQFRSANKKFEKAVNIYNNAISNKKSSDLSLNFGITRSGGIGFTLNF